MILSCIYIVFLFLTQPARTCPDENSIDLLYKVITKVTNFILAQNDDVIEGDVTFYLFNQQNKDEPINMKEEDLQHLSKVKPLVFVIHGYFEYGLKSLYVSIKNAYLLNYDFNVILVDWKNSARKFYSKSTENIRTIGKIIASRIIKSGVPLELINVVGHSLGGQMAGFIGKEILKLTNRKLGRIIALDPAGPLFEGASPHNRLTANDALKVQAIHTDGGFFGMIAPCGHVDFYPNFGVNPQPGCEDVLRIPKDTDDFVSLIACSHQRSIAFFTESINSLKLVARNVCPPPNDGYLKFYGVDFKNCNVSNPVTLGEHNSPDSSGVYILSTNSYTPYSRG